MGKTVVDKVVKAGRYSTLLTLKPKKIRNIIKHNKVRVGEPKEVLKTIGKGATAKVIKVLKYETRDMTRSEADKMWTAARRRGL
jgi:hypothetical protein